MADLIIVKTLYLKAPPAHVWKFLTDKKKLALWFYEAAESLDAVGPYKLLTNSLGKEGEKICWGEVLESEPPTRLVHTFTHDFLKETETICTWTLAEADGGTILTLEHSGFADVPEGAFDLAADHDKGWDEHFIRLRRITL
ncbi:MAG: SRPBCC domain-containing protein [Pseudomonadota bacterium]